MKKKEKKHTKIILEREEITNCILVTILENKVTK